VALGLSAQRIWQDLQEASDSAFGYESVKRFVRRFGEHMEPPFRRLESPPGYLPRMRALLNGAGSTPTFSCRRGRRGR